MSSTQLRSGPAIETARARTVDMKLEVLVVSSTEPASALRRAAAARGRHPKRTGKHDTVGWPEWYAEYIVAEQAGKELS